MKRCPQCEFIYEDEQHLCDMDGTRLVHDSRQFIEKAAGLTPASQKSARKRFAQVAIPAAVLGILSVLVFRHELVPQNQTARSSIAINKAKSVLTVQPTPSFSGSESEANLKKAVGGTSIPDDAAPKSYFSPTSKRERRRPRQHAASSKKDSVVGSFLKKTGRFLKKPFKH